MPLSAKDVEDPENWAGLSEGYEDRTGRPG